MNDWRKHSLFFCLIAMMMALFFSNFVLSVCTMLFVVIAFIHKDIKSQVRNFFSSPVLWTMSLLFVIPLVSGLWSNDKSEWLSVLRVKLPLLVLPLSFAGPFNFSIKQWKAVAFIFIGLIVGGTCWSMFHYADDIQTINASYLKAKTIVTPLDDDHVRFSWMVSIAILLCGTLAWRSRKQNRAITIIWALIIAWLIIFLHILAARTGIFSFYLIALATGVWLIFRRSNIRYGMPVLILLLLLPFAAYYLLPSFQNRVKYFLYDYRYAKELHYLPGGNDATRMISLRAGWNVLQSHPLTGTGAGDIPSSVSAWYGRHYPGMLGADMIYPSNEWLVYGLTAGWIGVLLFTFCMILPCLSRKENKLAWLLLNVTAAFSFLFDVGLEVQYGVFIYSFLVLWWWKWKAV